MEKLVTKVKCVINNGGYTKNIKVGGIYELKQAIPLKYIEKSEYRRVSITLKNIKCNKEFYRALHYNENTYITAKALGYGQHTGFIPYFEEDEVYEIY